VDYTNMSETDIAFAILQQKGAATWYKELIQEVLEKKNNSNQAVSHVIAEIYTLINMDSRFVYDAEQSKEEGRCMWGLAEWQNVAKNVTEEKA